MITDRLTVKEFEEYCQEFFDKYPTKKITAKLSFKNWIEILANTEWEMHTGYPNDICKFEKEGPWNSKKKLKR